MKLQLSISFLILTHILGAQNNAYIKLRGKIGDKLSITMDIQKNNRSTDIIGSYYYDYIGVPINIAGAFNVENIELTERDNKGNITGTFKGKLTSNNDMNGVWINPKTKKETPFTLAETHNNIAQFEYTEYNRENCDNKKRNLKSAKKDTLDWTDTLCTSIDITTIKLKNINAIAAKKIEALLEKNILQAGMSEVKHKNINELLHSVDGSSDTESYFDESYGMNVIYNEPNILCLSISFYGYAHGAAHPNGYSIYFNFNPQTGDTISLNDLLLPNTINKFTAIGKKKFFETNGNKEENSWFFDNDFTLANNFVLTKGGLLFQYNTYEAGPYAAGTPTFFIPKKELTDILKPTYLNN